MIWSVLSVWFLAYLNGVSAIEIDPSRKLEIMLPMRDEVKLHTIIFFPRDYEEGNGNTYTAVIDRSPYG
jgi:predicted acyl esterase